MMNRNESRLLDRRFDDEERAANAERLSRETFREGPPPDAQLVFNPNSGVGVAVKGAPFVCNLPKGYEGKGLELAVIDRGRLIVTHPDLPALLVDPQRGTTRAL